MANVLSLTPAERARRACSRLVSRAPVTDLHAAWRQPVLRAGTRRAKVLNRAVFGPLQRVGHLLIRSTLDELRAERAQLLARVESLESAVVTLRSAAPDSRVGTRPATARFLAPTESEPARESQPVLRIAIVSNSYGPLITGGVERLSRDLASGLAARGHQIHVIAPRGPFADDAGSELGVSIHRYDASRPGVELYEDGLVDDAAGVADIVDDLVARGALDVVFAPLWHAPALGVQVRGSAPVVTCLMTPSRLGLTDVGEETLDVISHLEAEAISRSSAVVAISRAIGQDVVRWLPHGGDFPAMHLIPLATKASPWPPSEVHGSGELTILYVGRFGPRKGTDVLLRALPDVLSSNPRVRVRLLGSHDRAGQGTYAWEDFVAEHSASPWFERVEAPGWVADEGLAREYAECDIFVAPSRYESFGLIYLEAMAAGKPVVACRAGGIPEVVEDGVTGLLVTPGDHGELAAALQRLIDSPDRRREMGRAGRHRASTVFAQDTWLDRMTQLFREVHRASIPKV